jgi:2-polyprenyl-3-methyl-5-hydroxy-6-metoxy-1,4-benzoquinol methylase
VNPDAHRYRSHDGDSVRPDTTSPFFLDHVARYWWAAGFTAGKRVLDCATGRGYGAYVLSRSAAHVLGIDLNHASLEAARAMFSADNLVFETADVLDLARLGRRFDVVTAFEIIEHVPPSATERFVSGIATVLGIGGIALVSTPNHDVVTKSGVSVPEFHINNLRPSDLRRALRPHFSEVQVLGQFRDRHGLARWLFALDCYNLRHVVHRQVRRVAAIAGAPRTVTPPADHDQRDLVGREFFERPAPGVEQYRFSARHWRQAGLSVAVCIK